MIMSDLTVCGRHNAKLVCDTCVDERITAQAQIIRDLEVRLKDALVDAEIQRESCRRYEERYFSWAERARLMQVDRDALRAALAQSCDDQRGGEAGMWPCVRAMRAERAERAEREAKDGAYLERNQCVAALSKLFPATVSRTAIEGWSEDWHGCVYIDLPTGQVSWHFHDSQAHLFAHLPSGVVKWDGHDTPEKYRRLAAIDAARAKP
jgi:hypothetical protein